MFKNYIKIAFRNLRNQPTVSFINIVGLAASMSICLLIILFIYDQRSYDQFHSQKDRLYRVVMDYKSASSSSSEWFATSPTELANILENEYTGIEDAVNVRASFGGETKSSGNTILPLQGFYTNPDFLEMFDFTIIQGNPQVSLSEPGNVVLTKDAAQKFFGDEDPMGKSLAVLGDREYIVSGVIEIPKRSHLKFEALASLSTTKSVSGIEDWTRNISNSYTYVILNEESGPYDIENQFPGLIQNHFEDLDEASIVDFDLQLVTEINLGRILSNEIGTVIPGVVIYFLAAFAAIIILIAFFNYIGLVIARSIGRGKEVGIRKVLGAFRTNLTGQFIMESILTSVLALILACFLLRLILPEFNSLYIITQSDTEIGTNFEANIIVLLLFLGFSIVTGFLAGIYPSMYLSKFEPATVLKGISTIKGVSSSLLRKMIVVTQFSFSLLFIISAILLFRQFNHMANTEYGFDEEHLVNVALLDVPYQRFAQEIERHPSVNQIAATSKIPAMGSVNGMWVKSDSIPEPIRANSFEVDENYLNAMGLELVSGRNFSAEYGSDRYNSVILNENALQDLNLGMATQAIGSQVRIEESTYQVIGVVENFISSSPLQNNDPAFLLNNPEHFYYASVKVHPNSLDEFLPFLKETWFDLGSEHSIRFQIFDDQLRENPIIVVFGDFIKILSLITLFTILISCLGLFGMAMSTSNTRIKEISIRKFLGASTVDLIILLSENYLNMMGISVLIGGTLAWLLNSIWLRNISNSIEMDSTVFLLGVLGIILLGLFTVSSQAIRAALNASVEKLRNE